MNIKSILALFIGAGVMPAEAAKKIPPRRFRLMQRESSYYKGPPAKPKRAQQIANRPAHHEPRFVKHPDPILVSHEARRQQSSLARAKAFSRKLDGLLNRVVGFGDPSRPSRQPNRLFNLADQYRDLEGTLDRMIQNATDQPNTKGDTAKA